MKKVMKGITMLTTGVLMLTACNDNGKSTATVSDSSTQVKAEDSAKMSSEKINTGGVTGSQNEFVTKAAIGGMMEVELGKYAQANAASKDVKEYGKMLESDHSEANEQLKSIAAANNIAIPASMDEEHTMHVKEMTAKKGADFDKAYINMMVEDHVKDIEEFKKAAAENSDPAVKKFAAAKLPILQQHLARAKDIKRKM